ncbi:MAG: G8 domain-containing protein [Verrucomicrobiaceae bacterium]|nr:G8 domain-containing protein [Verrucomicrobiaceae bacterium]
MKTKAHPSSSVLGLALVSLFLFAGNAAKACPLCHFNILLSEAGGNTPTRTATQDGNFTAGSTWGSFTTAPSASDVLLIPAGRTVTVNGTTPVAKTIVVRGVLRFPIVSTAKLTVEHLLIDAGGKLSIGDYGAAGTTGGPINAGIKSTVTIKGAVAGSTVSDTQRMGRGIIAAPGAIIRMNSAGARDPFVTLNNSAGPNTPPENADKTQTQPTSTVPANWHAGDDVVIAATYFTREWIPALPAYGDVRLANEVRSISAIPTTTSITLNSKLSFAHVRAKAIAAIKVHAANLTRDIVIESGDTTSSATRGHVMLMTNDVKITGVAFNQLGRSVKGYIISDPTLPAAGTPGNVNYNNGDGNLDGVINASDGPLSNSRGRYALHFHEAGTGAATPALVSKCVVRDTPGWGFVNHDSSVNFADNVCFDFDGAGFICEDGGETGSFTGNIAIGGIGNGEFANQRTIFGNRPRGDQGDMGFTGEGFWFQSPDVSVTGNVAAGCKGSGFFFWCGGRFDPSTGHFTGKPLNQLPSTSLKPRGWDYDGNGTADAAVITDLPVRQFDNNTAYGCFTGLRFRFVNHGSTAIFEEIRQAQFVSAAKPNGLADELVRSADDSGAAWPPSAATRNAFTVSNSTFWNNMNGIHGTYLGKANFSNINIVANAPALTAKPATLVLADDKERGGVGLGFFFNNSGCSLSNVTVENYITGLWFFSNTADGQSPNFARNPDGSFVGLTLLPAQTPETRNEYNYPTSLGNAPDAKGYDYLYQTFSTNNLPDF